MSGKLPGHLGTPWEVKFGTDSPNKESRRASPDPAQETQNESQKSSWGISDCYTIILTLQTITQNLQFGRHLVMLAGKGMNF